MNIPSIKKLLEQKQLWFALGHQALEPDHSLEHKEDGCACFGVQEIDQSLGPTLSFGSLHEWTLDNQLSSKSKNYWHPPIFLLSAVISQTLFSTKQSPNLIAWIGEKIWPTPHTLSAVFSNSYNWEKNCLFISAKSKDERLWSIIQILNSAAVLGIIADASGFNLIATRRIQLAAKKHNSLCFLLRPPWEIEQISCAKSKWRISPFNQNLKTSTKLETSSLKKSNQGEKYYDDSLHWKLELIRARSLPCPLSWQLKWGENPTQTEEEPKGSLYLVEEPGKDYQSSAGTQRDSKRKFA